MEEEINDLDAKLLFDGMSNTWRNEKLEREFEKSKQTNTYKRLCFLAWFIDFKTIDFIDLEPTEII